MPKTLTGINPDVLRWARERSGLSVSDVARKFSKSPSAISAWETGETSPTYVQLEKLAYQVYKRPVAIFFFPEPPDEPNKIGEFRTLPASERESLSSDTRYAVRLAETMQIALRELNNGVNPSPRKIFDDVLTFPHEPSERLAERTRTYLGISLEDQCKWSSTADALDQWRNAIEDCGVYVFKRSFKQRDISGFSLMGDQFPVIFLNNSTPSTRQIFTLWHEIAHILFNTSGVTKEDDSFIQLLVGESKAIEVQANAFAGEFLVPSKDFSSLIHSGPYSDEYFSSLADRYHVSREVVLRKHSDRSLVTQQFCEDKAREWKEQYATSASSSTGGNYYNTQVSYLGRKFLELVFSRYYQGRIDLSQLADYTNVKARNVPALEQAFMRKLSSS
ncbi:MAG: ImmA/IrrE family metallo-endopeptidase [Chloroflexota bacterium]|nr:ImmA/IrrE family metallo-endopeptidase [Chloroflexota bacterium]